MSYHFLCKRGIRPARTEQFLVVTSSVSSVFRLIYPAGADPGGSWVCFNKPDALFDRATDHYAMDKRNSMGRWSVAGRTVCPAYWNSPRGSGPPFGPRCRLFNIGPDAGPPPFGPRCRLFNIEPNAGPPPFFCVNLSWTPALKNPASAPDPSHWLTCVVLQVGSHSQWRASHPRWDEGSGVCVGPAPGLQAVGHPRGKSQSPDGFYNPQPWRRHGNSSCLCHQGLYVPGYSTRVFMVIVPVCAIRVYMSQGTPPGSLW